MSEKKSILAIAILALFLFSGCVEEPAPEPGEKGNINLFTTVHREEYLEDGKLEFVASHFDLVLMGFPLKEYTDKLKAGNPDIMLLLFNNPYFAFGEKFWEEGVEAEPGWLLRTEDGQAISYSGPEYVGTSWGRPALMDIRNRDWQEYYAGQSKRWIEYSGMDGLFIDTLSEGYQPWAFGPGYQFAKGYTEEGWRQSNFELLEEIKQALGEQHLIIYNGISNAPGTSFDLPNIGFLDETDGTAYEAFSVYLNMDKDSETKKWFFEHAIMTAMKKVAEEDKFFLIHVSGKNDNEEARLYALASFLLLQNDKTFFYYSPDMAKIYWYPEWELKIGRPLGEFYVENGIYKRDFENAQVSVNPKSFKGEILAK